MYKRYLTMYCLLKKILSFKKVIFTVFSTYFKCNNAIFKLLSLVLYFKALDLGDGCYYNMTRF
jgi:hypothetical protein